MAAPASATVLPREQDDPPPLDHPARRRILEYLTQHPGANLKDLCVTLAMNRGTAAHHLYILERHGMITSVRLGRDHRYYPDDRPPKVQRCLSLILKGRALELVEAVQAQPGRVQKDLTSLLSMSRKVFRGYVDLLTQEGLLEEVKASKERRYFPTRLIRSVLPIVRRRKALEAAQADDP